ncbi:small ubiquitin-like modifier 1 [Actinidia rufa]|uniref:Small ubiquitin-like modifier 1 n=1 Tax=Actinidia rufa TaxID=165716 RepID=A0A7J0FLB9_9ERIC|nr:small ubiquitin-like modifier 1 [Actinidia rufa]
MSATGGGGQEEDKKPTDQHINLKVKGQDGNEVFFRIKRSTQLRKLMTAYCDRQSVELSSIAFLFDGRRLRAEQTPDELEMEDGDEIDAMLHQTGGGHIDISQSLWEGLIQDGEDLSYTFDVTTPVKACGDLAYHVADGVKMNKELQHCRETSLQVKRPRMLQFDNEEREDSLEEALSDMSQWVSGFAEDTSASGYEGLDQSSEGWLADCFNDAEMHCSSEEFNLSGTSDAQIDNSEFSNTIPAHEATVAQQRPAQTHRNVVFKGRKSYIRTPTNLTSSVAYPFAFIKPCGVHGDVTLKDINQRIRTPPPPKPKQCKEDPPISYPTSAFSGKPVVGKTKIHTEGGKGSITIMRTKG